MPLSKFLDPKNDFAFKRIFGTEKNQDILIHFLNNMICFGSKEKIQTVSFLKTEQDPEIGARRQSMVDVLCADKMGQQYIVELRIAQAPDFENRAKYYAAKAYCRHKEAKYPQLKEIIFVAITDFVMFPDKAAYKSDHVVLDTEINNYPLSDRALFDKEAYIHDLKDFSFSFIELPKFTKTIPELSNLIEKWMYFFKHANETKEADLVNIVGEDEVIMRAFEALNRFSWSEIELNTYEQEEKRERDAQAIIEQKLIDIEAAKSVFYEQLKMP